MAAGILLIAFGILIALFPQILVVMLSAVLITSGLSVLMVSWRWRRMRQSSKGPFVNWMMRW